MWPKPPLKATDTQAAGFCEEFFWCKRDFYFNIFVLTSAVEDYQEAREFDGDSSDIREGLERAQKLLKVSRKRDYYKILGVSR